MLPKEFLAGTPLHLVPEEIPNKDGNDKIVYKVTDGMQDFAAKIYRKQSYRNGRAASTEFDTYQILRRTSLAPYIPYPFDLLKANGDIVGLLVEWKDGKAIKNYFQQELLPRGPFDDLEHSLLSLTHDQWLDPHCFDEDNIHWGNGLWLAELSLSGIYGTQGTYEQTVKSRMKYFRKYYVEK